MILHITIYVNALCIAVDCRDAMHGVSTGFDECKRVWKMADNHNWHKYRKKINMSDNKFNNKYRIPSARWADWDYGNEGAYFVTICTKHREHYFGEIINSEMQYTELGKIAMHEWLKSAELRPDMQLDMTCFQVMPNHIHGIVVIGKNCRDAMHGVSIGDGDVDVRDAMHGVSMGDGDGDFKDAMHGVFTANEFGPQSKNLASIMRGFKSAVTMQARKLNITFEWQTRFHDRVIRDDEEFRKIAGYIEQNPDNWEKDILNN